MRVASSHYAAAKKRFYGLCTTKRPYICICIYFFKRKHNLFAIFFLAIVLKLVWCVYVSRGRGCIYGYVCVWFYRCKWLCLRCNYNKISFAICSSLYKINLVRYFLYKNLSDSFFKAIIKKGAIPSRRRFDDDTIIIK